MAPAERAAPLSLWASSVSCSRSWRDGRDLGDQPAAGVAEAAEHAGDRRAVAAEHVLDHRAVDRGVTSPIAQRATASRRRSRVSGLVR